LLFFLKRVTVGTDVTLKCDVEADPPAEHTWFQDVSRVEELSNVRFSVRPEDGALVIRAAQKEDTNKYVCKVKNKEGKTSASAFVTVREATKVRMNLFKLNFKK